ncbi:unnamed protein product [Cylicocyclus nassatus]|uniref:DUF5641 domain-containing protein n=1 Tax=Cylicocyclus nassatus TaxID=53992 RepID=A0AA36M7H2_CYLNA|nr:unnamed protein product [Cylicocyclus nassatus]
MSLLGSYKARITKAAKALREKISEVDEAILQPLDPAAEASKDPHFILSHKSLLYLRFTLIDRAVAHLRAQREKAEEFARQNPDEQGEFPFLHQIQSHWDAGELDQLVEEADTLHARLDIAIKLLPSSEALFSIRTPVVPPSFSSVNFSPHPTQDPATDQPAQDARAEIASHSSSKDQDRSSEPDLVAPADTLPPRASSATQGFGVPPNHPPNPPTFGNPFITSSCPQSNPFAASAALPNPTSTQSSVEQSLKLPSFEIPTFHGDIDSFYEFWDLFSTAVHNNTSVPVPVKFMYLKSHLRGPAANIIAGFQSTVENYDDAVRILTNTYGRPEILRNKLWDKLLQLPPASESPQSQRATLCAVRATWTQLQHLKEDSSAIGTLRIIRAKFPRRTRERIGEFKNKGDPMWTVDELLNTLDTIIDRLENIEDADPSDYHSYNSQSVVRQYSLSPRRYPSENRTGEAFTRYRTPSRSKRSPSRSLSPRSRHERSSSPHYPRRASYSPTRSRRGAPSDVQCAFCHNFGHLPDRCRTIPDARQRRVFVSRHKLCWLCLQPDHTYIDCDEPLCPYCSKIHHRSLCLETLSVPRSPSPSPRQRYQDSHRSQSPRRVQFSEEAYRPSSRTSTRASSRGFQSRSPPPSKNRFSPTPSRRTSLSRRSRSPTSAVHSANCALDVHGTTNDTRSDSPDDHSPARTDVHPPSSCTSVCHDQSTPQEPRLMVVHAVTRNHKTNKSELLTVFLDSGSQYSFICTALAKHLGLLFRNTRTITTLTFGGHQYTEESSEVTLTLWDQYDYPIQLELWTREKITTVPRTNNCYDSTIVDPADRVEVDVLLGIDNYWRVVDLHRNEKLPSGLILSHTRFGPVLSGIQHPVVSNTLSTIHNFSDEDEPESERSIRSFLGLDVLGLDEGEDVDADVIRQFYSKIEAILNTRPLFPVNSSDPDTNVAIRPIDLITSDFQVARLTGNIPQKIANASSESYRALRTRYKSLQEDLDHFWQLWQTEYLDALAQRQVIRTNGQSSKKPPRVGEVVLVKQDAHRSTWPLALILELYTSSDGNIRSAKIRTAKKKILERSINHLVPLEIVADEETIPERGYEQHVAVKDTLRGTSKE